MKKVLLVLLTLASSLINSQPVTHNWASGYGGLNSSDDKMRTVVDNIGNIYIIGEFQGTKTFGSTTLTSISNRDVFVAKFSNTGVCQWAIKCSGPNFTSAKAGGIALDNNYNLYITGYFSQSLSVGVQSVTATGAEEIFIARLDNAGNCVWLKSAGFNFSDKANDIAFDGNNSIYVTGSFESFAFFDVSTSITSVNGTVDIFLAKYDLSGHLTWVKSAGGNQPNDVALAVKVDNAGNPLISGYFSGVSTFGTLPTVTSLGFGDLFVAKYDAAGNAVWVTRAGGVGQDEGKGLGLDAQNNVYVTGIFSDTIIVNGTQLNDNGYVNCLFIKMNATGVIQYSKRIGGNGLDLANDIAIEPGGHFYITGQYTGSATFGTLANGNGTAPSLVSSPPSNVEIFVAKYGGGGTPLWAFKIGNSGTDIGKSVAAIGSGKVLATGEFSSQITMGTTTLTSAATFGSYLTELSGGTLGLNNNDQIYTLKPYPNPAVNSVKVELPFVLNESLSCEISNVKGQIISSNNLTMNADRTVTVKFINPKAGVYNVRLFNKSFDSISKVIVE